MRLPDSVARTPTGNVMSNLVLVRHGESRGNAWSEANRDDRTNFLSQKGRKQAEIAGMELALDFFGFTTVISSKMTRSCETMVTIMSQFGDKHQRDYITDKRFNECRNKDAEQDHKVGVYSAMTEIVAPALLEGDVLCVTHYFTMQRIFDFIKINRGQFWCEGKHIPNAMPFVYNSYDEKWTIYNHYFERKQFL